MMIEATIMYDNIKCSGEQYVVVEPKEMIHGKEWRAFKCCPNKEVAEAVLRATKAKYPEIELKIVLIKWQSREVKL